MKYPAARLSVEINVTTDGGSSSRFGGSGQSTRIRSLAGCGMKGKRHLSMTWKSWIHTSLTIQRWLYSVNMALHIESFLRIFLMAGWQLGNLLEVLEAVRV